MYSVEVTADAPALERYLRSLMPDEEIQVSASGNSITLSGQVKDPTTVARAVQIAQTTGATVIDNLVAPPAVQVLLQGTVRGDQPDGAQGLVRPAQCAQSARDSSDGNWCGFTDPGRGRATLGFLLDSGNAEIQALIQAAVSKGDLRTLAEPNLLTLPGKEAYFLAGGEFPYPSVQSGAGNAVTITFKEFGIRLRFTPNIARNGAIRLEGGARGVHLDFANGADHLGIRDPLPPDPPGRDRGGAAGGPVPRHGRTAGQRVDAGT